MDVGYIVLKQRRHYSLFGYTHHITFFGKHLSINVYSKFLGIAYVTMDHEISPKITILFPINLTHIYKSQTL